MSIVFSRTPYLTNAPKTDDTGTVENGYSLAGKNDCTVILIHGLTGTPHEMRFLATYLNKKGYSVVCPRLAYHGEPLGVLKNARWQDFYGSVRAALTGDGLAKDCDHLFVAGLSMGALLALVLAHDFKDRVSGVTCLAPTLYYDGWNTPLSAFFLPLAYYTPLKYFCYYKEEPPYGVRNEHIQNRIHQYYHNARLDNIDNVAQYGYPFIPLTLLYQLQCLVRHLKTKLPGIKAPLQTIQAKDDDMTSIKNSKYIYDRVSSEIKEMIFLYNSYHVISVDQEREIVAEKMEGFFTRCRT
ncbi:MAG: alpha/beta fold hydrolase [Candidatus Omnitrophica bacterium]|nr:alpha/beta fold hydrolase [Candidatus Omnitrophota bacterium]